MRRFNCAVPAAMLFCAALAASAQMGAKDGEWRTYGGDIGNTKYSPLDQINAGNFDKLKIAWRFTTANLGPRPEFNLETTPLMVKGVVYATAGSRRDVVALDATSGELLWVHGENEGARGDAAPRRLSGRGLSYWTDGREERILYVTPGYRLVALNAKTGAPITAFGKGGMVDLKLDDDQEMDSVTGEVGLHAAPTVAGNTIIVGAAHLAGGTPKSKHNVRATSADSTSAPASACGFSIPSPSPASSATTRGRTIRPITPATPACGDRSASMKSSAWCICPSRCPPAITSAAIVPETACSAKASWPWT